MNLRTIKINLLIMLLLSITLVVFLETYLNFSRPKIYQPDKHLGWKIKSNISLIKEDRDYLGIPYKVDFSTNEQGLRITGALKPDLKILILGDSYTMEPTSSNNDMWFAEFGRVLELNMNKDIMVTAGGGGGWGTYQNILLAKQIAQNMSPDIFILQFCENDYSNNLFELESKGIVRNQYLNRPYGISNGNNLTFFRTETLSAQIYRAITNYSRLASFIDSRIQAIQYSNLNGYFYYMDQFMKDKLHKEAIETTGHQLKEFKNIFPKTSMYILNCSESKDPVFSGIWKDLATHAGFKVLSQPSLFVSSIREAKETNNRDLLGFLNIDGAHLSNIGNKKFGEIAANEFLELKH